MSIRQTKGIQRDSDHDQAVEAYLRANPEFFVSHPGLLAELTLPHPSGAAVSLVERQIALLREQNRRARERLQELIQIARDNDQLSEYVHQLTLDLLGIHSLDKILVKLHDGLRQNFRADAIALCLTVPTVPLSFDNGRYGYMRVQFITQGDGPGSHPEELFHLTEPLCGRLEPDQLEYLFGADAGSVSSVAVLPLAIQRPRSPEWATLGLMAIGSREAGRFHGAIGTHFLGFLGQLISHKLGSCLQSCEPPDV